MDPQKVQVFVVKRDSPAHQALMRICEDGISPGAVLPVDEDEFESFTNDMMLLEITNPES